LLSTRRVSSKIDSQTSATSRRRHYQGKGMRPPKEPPIARASKKGGRLSGRLAPDWMRIVTWVGMYDSSADALCDRVALLPQSHFARRQPIEAGINLDFCCGVHPWWLPYGSHRVRPICNMLALFSPCRPLLRVFLFVIKKLK
jgi:hypothetical protein